MKLEIFEFVKFCELSSFEFFEFLVRELPFSTFLIFFFPKFKGGETFISGSFFEKGGKTLLLGGKVLIPFFLPLKLIQT